MSPARTLTLLAALAAATACSSSKPTTRPAAGDKNPVRVAVIGGMTMTGVWPRIAEKFTAATGYPVEVVITGPRPGLAAAMREGRIDLLTMHSGDITTGLVADGFATNLRPWAKNDLVIVGPASDPAKIKGMKDGAAALKQIVAAKAKYVDFHGIGSREVALSLWKRSGVEPTGDWVVKDESGNHKNILLFAQQHDAYVIVGRMPVLWGKIQRGAMEILVDTDPLMRRTYVVMEANPRTFPKANIEGAKALADFLLSEPIQQYLADAPENRRDGTPLFYPVSPAARATP
ncbi:MAG: substrate-binding domain-containing protein [Planctomycetaceae bacterium]|nr:substrate-binding domain-containing protein [Planctomycetaceae bacterium]